MSTDCEILTAFGHSGKCHTTIIHLVKTMKILMQNNPSPSLNHIDVSPNNPTLFKTVNRVAQAIDSQSDNQEMTFSFD